MAKVRARQAAATGKERPKKVSEGEEKKSMSFPMVRGMSMETEDETRSCERRRRTVESAVGVVFGGNEEDSPDQRRTSNSSSPV
jgi:hypothetical protein